MHVVAVLTLFNHKAPKTTFYMDQYIILKTDTIPKSAQNIRGKRPNFHTCVFGLMTAISRVDGFQASCRKMTFPAWMTVPII